MVSKSITFLVKSILGNYYGHLAIFIWSHWTRSTFRQIAISHIWHHGRCGSPRLGRSPPLVQVISQVSTKIVYLEMNKLMYNGLARSYDSILQPTLGSYLHYIYSIDFWRNRLLVCPACLPVYMANSAQWLSKKYCAIHPPINTRGTGGWKIDPVGKILHAVFVAFVSLANRL